MSFEVPLSLILLALQGSAFFGPTPRPPFTPHLPFSSRSGAGGLPSMTSRGFQNRRDPHRGPHALPRPSVSWALAVWFPLKLFNKLMMIFSCPSVSMCCPVLCSTFNFPTSCNDLWEMFGISHRSPEPLKPPTIFFHPISAPITRPSRHKSVSNAGSFSEFRLEGSLNCRDSFFTPQDHVVVP